MSAEAKRPNRDELKQLQQEKKDAEAKLRADLEELESGTASKPGLPNRTSSYSSVDEEQEDRLDKITKQVALMRDLLPVMLRRLSQITDPRQPKKTKHTMAVLFIYGILMFVFQFFSRREVNREMTRPQFKENLKLLFPDLEQLPHADTLFRLLRDLEKIEELEETYLELLKHLIRKKKFQRYLINGCYPISIDGSQKFCSDTLWDENPLQRTVGKTPKSPDGHQQYYVYVLEASLCFQNGMVIPFLSEFLEYGKGDSGCNKQDCELRAFKRLVERIREAFPRLRIILFLDGLYANRPVIDACRAHHLQYMIVLRDKCLSTVWEEIDGLRHLGAEKRHWQQWGNRRQDFWWFNSIRYETSQNGKEYLTLHVVGCDETWKEVNAEAQTETKTGRHVWLSSCPLTTSIHHERCNLGARHRWGIEANFLVEKHQGYSYEHRFSSNWQAMKGYHCLMKIAPCFNVLARFSEPLAKVFREMGVRPFLRFLRETCAGPWLNPLLVQQRLQQHFQLRLE